MYNSATRNGQSMIDECSARRHICAWYNRNWRSEFDGKMSN